MDRTKKVHPAYQEFKKRQGTPRRKKPWTLQQDMGKFERLKKKLEARWGIEDRKSMRQFLQKLAEEV
jgi:hypothetical protein